MNDFATDGNSGTDDAFLMGMACGLLVEDDAPVRRFTVRDLALGIGIVAVTVGGVFLFLSLC